MPLPLDSLNDTPAPESTGVTMDLLYQLQAFTCRLRSCTIDPTSEGVEALREAAKSLPVLLESRIRRRPQDVDLSWVSSEKLLRTLLMRNAGGKPYGIFARDEGDETPNTEPLPDGVIFFCHRCNRQLGTCDCGEQSKREKL